MFRKNDIKRAIGAEPAITDEMLQKISQWLEMYRGKAEWITDYVRSLRIEQGICREFTDVVLSELDINVTNEKLDGILKKHISALNENMQSGLALGSFCLKPLGDDKAEFVTADKFIPLNFDDGGNLTGVVFVSTKKIKSDSFYRRFELHELTSAGLHISNFAYHSASADDMGRPCDLAEVDEWADLIPDVTYPSDRMDLGYYRNPIKNEIDDTFCGVSIYDSAIDLIKKADIQFGRLEWEYESGERVIHVDVTALQASSEIGLDGKKNYSAPKLNKRLYRGLNLDGGSGGELYKEWSPQFRDESIIKGLEQIKRSIEFNVGLAYGDLSDVQSVEKTATEVKHAKQRKYNRVNAIENNLQKCLEDFCYGLAFYNGLTKSGYEITVNFSDSILTDEETERNQDRQDLANGTLRPEEYRAKWRGETIEEALKNLPQSAQVVE